MSHSSDAKYLLNAIQFNPQQVSDYTDDQLLDAYLTMPTKQRDRRFVDTASAAEMAGISQRTIELWIEAGDLRAVLIGKKYKVSIDSLVIYLKKQVGKKTSRALTLPE
jgi:excisionase family DNA binding protein